MTIENGRMVALDGSVDVPIVEMSAEPIEAEVNHQHKEIFPMNEKTDQGDTDVSWTFGTQRAVVDVDLDLG